MACSDSLACRCRDCCADLFICFFNFLLSCHSCDDSIGRLMRRSGTRCSRVSPAAAFSFSFSLWLRWIFGRLISFLFSTGWRIARYNCSPWVAILEHFLDSRSLRGPPCNWKSFWCRPFISLRSKFIRTGVGWSDPHFRSPHATWSQRRGWRQLHCQPPQSETCCAQPSASAP